MKRRTFIRTAARLGTGIAAAGFAAPAISQNRVRWKLVTAWPKNFPALGTGTQRIANAIEQMSDGRMEVKVYGAGELVPAFEVFDAVREGVAEAGHDAPYYWLAKHSAMNFFCSVPGGLTAQEHVAWIYFGGGQELWDELSGSFGLKCLSCGNTGVQMGGWFRKEINSADDLKGLKMRIPGLGGDVMAKLGASPVSLPGGQIYENLISGAIDATEWVGPWNDAYMKFYEAAKYYYYPGMHEPASMLAAGCNKSWLTSLSASDQALIEAAATCENDIMMSEYNANNGSSLKKLIDEQGVVLKEFNDDVYDAFAEASEEVYAEVVEHSDLANRTHESFVNARGEIGAWMKLSDGAYLKQRNRALGV
mgnify:CR=1 FL=1